MDIIEDQSISALSANTPEDLDLNPMTTAETVESAEKRKKWKISSFIIKELSVLVSVETVCCLIGEHERILGFKCNDFCKS